MKKQLEKKVNQHLKMAIIFVLVCVSLWIGSSYKKVELTQRAIVIGLGIDFSDEVFEVTAEVISPSGGAQAQDTKTKLLTGKGRTVPTALQDIYQKSGKNPSLGQTGIIVLGEGIGQTDVRHVLSYFVFSDAFKDGATVAMCQGTAKKIFETTAPTDDMVSVAIQSVIQQSGEMTNSISNYLQKFIDTQNSQSKTSFISHIEFEKIEPSDDALAKKEGKESGLYNCSKVAIFKEGRFLSELTESETRGFILLDNKATYDTFVVDNVSLIIGQKGTVSLGVLSKSIKSDMKFDGTTAEVDFTLDIRLTRMRTDNSGIVMDYIPKSETELGEIAKTDVKKQIEQLINQAVSKSIELDADFLEIANNMYRKFANKWKSFQKDNPNYLKNVKFNIIVNVGD